jgi:zinc transporter, ZIP family
VHENALAALGLTLFAGLSTGIGALIVFFARSLNTKVLSFGLGFSGGVMVYVSMVELLPQGIKEIGEGLGEGPGEWVAIGCFFGGMLLSALIDKLVPSPENPHEATPLADIERAFAEEENGGESARDPGRDAALARVGLISALAIAIHNFPEGIATFASALNNISVGTSIAIAVAIHNIPEGIAVAIPVYFATRSRKRAFIQSFASGLAEPIGALLAFLILMPFLTPVVVGAMLSAVGGIMVFISFDELLPTAREYDTGHTAIAGIVLGMAVMAVSLLML